MTTDQLRFFDTDDNSNRSPWLPKSARAKAGAPAPLAASVEPMQISIPDPIPALTLPGERVPSPFQAAIYDWVVNGRGDAFVDAVAGSGKSTTLIGVANRLKTNSALFLAFNKSIAEELAGRLPAAVRAATIHATGFGMVRQVIRNARVDDAKYRTITREAFEAMGDEVIWKDKAEMNQAITDLVSLVGSVQAGLIDWTDELALDALVDHNDLDLCRPEVIRGVLGHVLDAGQRVARTQGVLSFGDMIWLPNIWNITPRDQKLWVLVDEAQDLSPAQFGVALRVRAPGGRMLFVGDPFQSIYGFAGADTESVNTIVKVTGAVRMPLSVCYRCPTSHLDLARKIVPHILPAPGAKEGVVRNIGYDLMGKLVREGDMVICRTTAPLIGACLELIASGVPARVRGRDIGKQLGALAKKVAKGASFRYAGFLLACDAYYCEMAAKLEDRDDAAMRLESLNDQLTGLKTCFEAARSARDLDELITYIEGLFSDGRPSVTLSTVHRAKGLETNRVFILAPELMPHPKAKDGWQLVQELNLRYVALTRAKEELFMVAAKPKAKPPSDAA